MSALPRLLTLACVLVTWTWSDAHAQITITQPVDGLTVTAEPCPVAPCTAEIDLEVDATGLVADRVVLLRTGDPSGFLEQVLCSPPDPIEGIEGCPNPLTVFALETRFTPGTWTLVARLQRGTVVLDSPPVHLTVLPPTLASAGPVRLLALDKLSGAPPILARDPGPGHLNGIFTEADRVSLIGENLHTNPFLEVYASPIPFGEPTIPQEAPIHIDDWCLFPVDPTSHTEGTNASGSFLRFTIPSIPPVTPTTCGFAPSPEGSSFAKNWRWVVRDPWITDRPEREHEWWAIPSPRLDSAHGAPPFRMQKPGYPKIDGFGFSNHGTPAGLNEFLTVYGRNAYLCGDCIPFVGCACTVAVPDPLYWTLWLGVYKVYIDLSGGSCNGMSATSLLMAREELQPEAFEPDVHFPVGFDTPGPNAVMTTKTRKDGTTYTYPAGVATYEDTNFCTPLCSPPKPSNLWANIRMNHGVQLTQEFFSEVLDTIGEAIFDPNDLATIKGIPEATLERVRANPSNHVICFFKFGGGHCVTPYRVDGNKIYVYDNNAPNVATRYIEIADGDYDYPARRDDEDTPNHGNAIVAFPLDIWKHGRHAIGLGGLVKEVGDDIVSFLQTIVVGSADMTVTTADGGRWGWEDDGTFTDSLFGALALPPLGPPDTEARAMPLLVAMNQPAPQVQINSREHGPYTFHVGAAGHLFQLEVSDALAGDKDRIGVAHDGGQLQSFSVTPQRHSSHLAPRVGLTIGDQESSVFHWLGLQVPAGKTIGFTAAKQDKAATYSNDTGAATHHVLALDHASGPANAHGRMIYGPFEVPKGAAHRVALTDWPDAGRVTSELDFDRDGTADHSEVVTGRSVTPGTRPLSGAADLSVSKSASAPAAPLGQAVTFTVTVSNAGPDAATNVILTDALPGNVSVSQIAASRGTCASGADGLSCALGSLAPGSTATVTYRATSQVPGTLANGAFVFGDEGDPTFANNTAVATVDLSVLVDIKPGNSINILNPNEEGIIPVAILGRAGFDVTTIDPSTLTFGPGGAPAVDPQINRVSDVNRDGVADLVSHYRVNQTGISASDTTACVRGAFRSGRALGGCDVVRIVPAPRPE